MLSHITRQEKDSLEIVSFFINVYAGFIRPFSIDNTYYKSYDKNIREKQNN